MNEGKANEKGDREVETASATEMPFLKHLEELRGRLIKCVLALIGGFAVCYGFSDRIFSVLMKPLCWSFQDKECQLHFTGLSEPFMVYLRVGVLGGILLVSPYVLFQIWRFVAPGLYRRERRVLWPFVWFSTLFFLLGALFGYFVVFPFGFKFFLGYASPSIRPILTMNEYLGLAATLLVVFGLVFELPLFLLLLSFLNIVSSRQLLDYWRYAVVMIAIASAVLTPADCWTMILMGVPLVGLYFLSILLIRAFHK